MSYSLKLEKEISFLFSMSFTSSKPQWAPDVPSSFLIPSTASLYENGVKCGHFSDIFRTYFWRICKKITENEIKNADSAFISEFSVCGDAIMVYQLYTIRNSVSQSFGPMMQSFLLTVLSS